MEDKRLKGLKVLIYQQRGWGFTIGEFLAKKLQGEGCRLAAITFKRTTHKMVTEQKKVNYELIIGHDDIMANPKAYLGRNNYTLEEICTDLGIDSIWPIVATLRNHVKSYKDKFYYGYKQNVSDEEIVCYVKAFYKCVKTVFEKFEPDVIISPIIIVLPHIFMNLYATKRGVTMLGVTDSKVRGFDIFYNNHKEDKAYFIDHLRSLNACEVETFNREIGQKYIREFRRSFITPVYADKVDGSDGPLRSLMKSLKKELMPYRLILDWYLNKNINFIESTGISIDYKPPRILLRDHYCAKSYKKYMEGFDYYPFEKLGKIIYFPLQFQPEATIDSMSPFFSNQIETARQVAMALPGDYTLVVKEHPAMVGFRSPSYVEKVARTVNVKLIDYRISSADVLKKADMVISPNSTTLAEAAFYNKPCIQLGDQGTTLMLPNVFRHSDMTTLSIKIKKLLAMNFETGEYERKLENFIAAVYDTGFAVDYQKTWFKKNGDSLEAIWVVYKTEIMRLLDKAKDSL